MSKLTPTDKEMLAIIDPTIAKFHGNSVELQNAVGAFMLGRHLGWRVLFLIHHKTSIKKYEKILGISFREILPETGPKSNDSRAWRAFQGFSNFWKAVKGEIPGIRTPELSSPKK